MVFFLIFYLGFFCLFRRKAESFCSDKLLYCRQFFQLNIIDILYKIFGKLLIYINLFLLLKILDATFVGNNFIKNERNFRQLTFFL